MTSCLVILGVATLMSLGDCARTRLSIQRNMTQAGASDVSESSSGIHVLMAAGRAAGVRNARRNHGFSGGTFRVKEAPPQPPAWTLLPLGCDDSINSQHCVLTMVQSACEARHPGVGGVTPLDACNRWWTSGKKEPRHMYCQAAMSDPQVKEFGARLAHLAPSESKDCQVDQLKRISGYRFTSSHPELDAEAKKVCGIYLTANPDGNNYGFCRGSGRPGQDCDFLWGLRAGWSSDYGKPFCESLQDKASPPNGLSGMFRCLGLRKQLIRIAQAKSIFGTAYFHSFDDTIRIKKEECPEPPKDLPDAPVSKEEIEVLEHVQEEE